MIDLDRSTPLRYGGAALAVLLGTSAGLALHPALGQRDTWVTLLLAVIFAAWYGGLGPSLLALGLGAISGAYFFLGLPDPSPVIRVANLLGLGLYLVAGTAIVAFGEAGRRRVARALREAGSRLSAVVDHSPATISLKDSRGRYLLVNRRFEELVRRSDIVGPYVGKTDAELLPPALAELFRRDDLEVLDTKRVKVFEQAEDLGGERRTVLMTKFPLLDEAGDAYAVCGMSLDITERKRAEERVRFQAHLLDAVGQAVIATDPQGRVLYWNRSAESLYGWAAGDATGRSILDLVVAPDSAGRAAEIMGLMRAGESWSGEFEVRRRDGTTFPAFVTDTPVFDDGGALTAVIGVTSDISKRKQAEGKLRESEGRFARFMQHLPGLAWIKDVRGRYVYANDAAKRAFGAPRADLYGKSDDEVFPPETAAQFRDHDRRALDGGAGVQVVETLEHADGVLHHSLVSKFPMPGPDGEMALVGGIAIDITDRMRAEDALRESEGRFRGLMEQAPFSIQVLAPDGRTLRVNRAWEELWGVTLDQIADYNMLRDPQLEAKDVMGHIRRAFAGEPAIVPAIQYDPNETIPDRTRHADPRRWVSAVAYPLKDAAGRVREVVLVHDDITVRKRAEEELRRAHAELEARVAERTAELARANEFLRALLESIQVGIVACDAEGVLTLFNRATVEFHGLPPEPLSADRWAEHYDLYRADGQTRMSPEEIPLLRALRGERVRDVEMVIAPKGGPRRTLLASGQAFRDDRGGRLGAVVSMHDISERKHAEGLLRTAHEELERRVKVRTAELARANDALQEADRRKDEFLATLAHELRNPLAPIRTALHLMGHPTGVGRDFEVERAMAERQVVHLARLIDDLMDVARISRGKIELREEVVDLATAVNQAVETARPLIDERRHNLIVSLPGEAIRLEGDPTRMEQVLWNLLNNAAKYTEPGGEIRLTVEPGVGEVAIRVRDTGIGLPRDSLPHIFDMFVQVDHRPGRSQGGLGIGLGLVKTLVEMHGGTITASSEGPGQGSEFTVRLPMMSGVIGGRDGPKAEDRGRSEGSLPRRRILVADDNVDAANSLARLLTRLHGQEVRVAHDGPEALALAGSFLPEVALLDIGMPGMDGYEVARRLRANPDLQGLLLVALTGWGQEDDRRRSEEAGFDRHLVKPVDPEVVRELLVGLRPVSEPADPPVR